MLPPAFLAIVVIGLAVAGCSRTAPILNVSSAPVPGSSVHLGATPAEGEVIQASAENSSAALASRAIGDAKSGRLSAEQVHDAIIEAATDKGWIVTEDDPGRLMLELLARRHSALVSVDYSPTSYSITYEDSTLLLYDGSNIHRNYNKWIELLRFQIDRRLTHA